MQARRAAIWAVAVCRGTTCSAYAVLVADYVRVEGEGSDADHVRRGRLAGDDYAGLQAVSRAARQRVPVKFFAYPVPGHSPADPIRSRDVFRRWTAWFKPYLADAAAPGA